MRKHSNFDLYDININTNIGNIKKEYQGISIRGIINQIARDISDMSIINSNVLNNVKIEIIRK